MAKENKTLVVRIDEELHRQLKMFCAEKGTSIKDLIHRLIREEIEKNGGGK